MQSHPDLSMISLSNCNIDDQLVKMLAKAMKRSKIESIGLTENNIGDKGAQALAEAFPFMPQLKALHLDGNNNIGDAGNQALYQGARLCAEKGQFIILVSDSLYALSSHSLEEIEAIYNAAHPRALQRLAFAQLCQRRLCPPSLSAHTSPDVIAKIIGEQAKASPIPMPSQLLDRILTEAAPKNQTAAAAEDQASWNPCLIQ